MEKNRLRRFGRLALVVAQAAQGYGNATLDANQALWELARRAAAAPGGRAALLTAPRSAAPTAVEQAGDAAFVGAWRAFLDRYGWRSEGWDLGCPPGRSAPRRRSGSSGACSPRRRRRRTRSRERPTGRAAASPPSWTRAGRSGCAGVPAPRRR
jgi:hypothetical protein